MWKTKFMKRLFVGFIASFVLMLFACGHSAEGDESAQVADYQTSPETDEAGPKETHPPGNPGVTVARKLIKEGNLEYRVDDLNEAVAALKAAAARWNGYISNESGSKDYNRISASLTIRVPASSFDSLLKNATAGIPYFDAKNILVRDVTDEYVDVEARLKTKKELEQRYLALLKKANSVEDILNIEREIGTLRADIESIEGRLQVMKDQVALATLQITVYEMTGEPAMFGEKVRDGFTSGWSGFLDFLILLVNLWPMLLAGGLALWGFRRWRKAKKRV